MWTSAINDEHAWHGLGMHLVRGMSVICDSYICNYFFLLSLFYFGWNTNNDEHAWHGLGTHLVRGMSVTCDSYICNHFFLLSLFILGGTQTMMNTLGIALGRILGVFYPILLIHLINITYIYIWLKNSSRSRIPELTRNQSRPSS